MTTMAPISVMMPIAPSCPAIIAGSGPLQVAAPFRTAYREPAHRAAHRSWAGVKRRRVRYSRRMPDASMPRR